MTMAELRARQQWPLVQKIDHSIGVVEQFVNRMGGPDRVYLSFSGGKDSTVLSHIARMVYPDMLHVFINTGNEYPEIVQFVSKQKDRGVNILVLRPELTPRQVWAKYGFPIASKEISQMVSEILRNPCCETSKKRLDPSNPYRLAAKHRYLLDEPYSVSHKCCAVLKKNPAVKFSRSTGRMPILGTMADESALRAENYVMGGGCNVFRPGKISSSKPLSIWKDRDIWDCIERFGLEISEIYHKGACRTGCVGCGFGAHFKNDRRFDLLWQTHPKYYEMIMKYENSGIPYREALRKLLLRSGKTLPDERPKNLFGF